MINSPTLLTNEDHCISFAFLDDGQFNAVLSKYRAPLVIPVNDKVSFLYPPEKQVGQRDFYLVGNATGSTQIMKLLCSFLNILIFKCTEKNDTGESIL